MEGKDICSLDNCTGCFACENVCPKSCIDLQPNQKSGHIYPVVNQDLCINCGLCRKTCPSNKMPDLKNPLTAFAAIHNVRDEYLTSTSGGAATAFAQYILSNNGIVYGCESGEGLAIRHIRIESIDEVHRLKGSKYVQSTIDKIYRDIKTDLSKGYQVLFIGTPCQVAGLKAFLRDEYKSLYTVDLICHGVPSQINLLHHIHKVTGKNASRISFRSGNNMEFTIYDNSGNSLYRSNVWKDRYKDIYYSTFIDGYTYRDSCYKCKYARPQRISDITIGDFWGLGKDLKDFENDGWSCILPVSQKGYELVKNANLKLYERLMNEAIQGNPQLQHPSQMNNRKKFFRLIYPITGQTFAYRLCELDHIIKRYMSTQIILPIRKILSKWKSVF